MQTGTSFFTHNLNRLKSYTIEIANARKMSFSPVLQTGKTTSARRLLSGRESVCRREKPTKDDNFCAKMENHG